MNTKPNLQICIHKVDGTITTLVPNDADESKKILDGFEPMHIFDRDRFLIADGNSITSMPASKITRIDLIFDLPHLAFPAIDAVELTETEFQALTRNPVMREQWAQMATRDDAIVTFLELELADGQRIFLTTEMHVELQSEAAWQTNGYPLHGSSLCFRMHNGGVAALNLANLVRLTFFPKPLHPLADAWQARQFYSQTSARYIPSSHSGVSVEGNLSAVSFERPYKKLAPLRK